MVGTTVQTMQKVGWIGVTPIEGLELPYWAGLWLGVYPTWQGVLAQCAAAVFVVGRYLAAEAVRKQRRERRFSPAPSVRPAPTAVPQPASVEPEIRLPAVDHAAEPVGTR